MEWSVAVTGTSAGSPTVTGNVTGSPADPVPANNTASQPLTVVASAATSTVLASSLNPSTVGGAVTFTATVRSSAAGVPTGTVTFIDGAASLGSSPVDATGHAAVTTSSLTQGVHSIKASFGGDAHFAASVSPVISQAVHANTTTTLASSPNPSFAGAVVVFTAHVTSAGVGTPTGNVSFSDGGTSIGYATVDGSGFAALAYANLTAGAHSITANYLGDTSFNASVSTALSQTVTPAAGAATTTTLASSPNPSVLGQSVTFTATVTSTSGTPTGSVAFTMTGTTPLGSAVLDGAGHATLTTTALPAGTRAIVAVYGGSASYQPSKSGPLSQVIKNTTSVAVTSSANPSAPGQSVTLTATISQPPPILGYPTGTMTFSDGATVLGTPTVVFPGKATFTTSALASGSHSITATYSGDSAFVGSTSPAFTEVVTGPTKLYTLTPCRLVDTRNPNGPYGGPALSPGGTRTFTLTGQCGIPSGAVSVAVNVVATGGSSTGYFTLYAPSSPRPNTSTLNFGAGKTRANNAIIGLGTAGDVAVYAGQASGSVNLVLDVTGYFK
jgi:hypothetical protein